MLCREIIDVIEKTYPASYAMEWDNVGFLLGSPDRDVKKIYVALDAVDAVIEEAVKENADMLVTHHPLIFSGMRQIRADDFTGRRLIRLIKEDIACYAMHTNYDVLGMAELSEQRMGVSGGRPLMETHPEGLADKKPQGIGRVVDLETPMSLLECCRQVKERFCLEHVKVFGDLNGCIKRIAISPGAGKSMVNPAVLAQADVLITGDMDHHTGIDAVARGLSVIDGGHYGIEKIFIPHMAEFFRDRFPEIQVIAAPESHPFQIM